MDSCRAWLPAIWDTSGIHEAPEPASRGKAILVSFEIPRDAKSKIVELSFSISRLSQAKASETTFVESYNNQLAAMITRSGFKALNGAYRLSI